MKKIILILAFMASFSANAQSPMDTAIQSFLQGGQCCTSSGGSIMDTDSQSLSIVGNVLTISRGNSITLPSGGGSGIIYVDSVSSNLAGDSLIVFKNGTRKAYKYPSGGGGSGGSYNVISSDNTVNVSSSVVGGVTTFDVTYNSASPNNPASQALNANTIGATAQSIPAGIGGQTAVLFTTISSNTFLPSYLTYNSATGLFTVNTSGNYQISYAVRFDIQSHTATLSYLAGLNINGTTISTTVANTDVTVTKYLQIPTDTKIVRLNAGDVFKIIAAHSESGARNLQGNNRGNNVSVAFLSL
jgi:hypothetical protein